VAGMIIYTSLGLGRRTLDVLLDKAPKGAHERIVETVSGLEGVNRTHNIRVRKVGPETFVDMRIEVPRTYTHDKAHRVATAVEERVRDALPNSDVLVHVDATELSNETIKDRIRLVAAETEGIKNVHSIYLSDISSSSSSSLLEEAGDRDKKREEKKAAPVGSRNLSDVQHKKTSPELSSLHVYLDVQMDDSLDLKYAHEVIDDFEKRLTVEIPLIRKITTHLETEPSEHIAIGSEKSIKQSYLEKIRNAVLSVDRVIHCSDIGVVDINGELHITLTVKIKTALGESTTTVEEAHTIATIIQNLIIKETGASRVIVHTEPAY
jgi:divalent metal cation (Fe/Co/Zn/Cd) transporter